MVASAGCVLYWLKLRLGGDKWGGCLLPLVPASLGKPSLGLALVRRGWVYSMFVTLVEEEQCTKCSRDRCHAHRQTMRMGDALHNGALFW